MYKPVYVYYIKHPPFGYWTGKKFVVNKWDAIGYRRLNDAKAIIKSMCIKKGCYVIEKTFLDEGRKKL